MSLWRLLWSALAPALLGATALGAAGLALVEGVERAESLRAGLWAWAALVVLRVPLLARELLPLGLAAGLAAGLAGLRGRGELTALEAAGVSVRGVWGRAAALSGLLGLALALGLEAVCPPAREALAQAELGLGAGGRPGEASWARAPGGLLRARWGPAGLSGVTLVYTGPDGVLERVELPLLRATPAGWETEGALWVRLEPHGPVAQPLGAEEVQALLPPPEVLSRLAQALSPAEQSVPELAASPLAEARPWLRWRLAGLLAPGALALGLGWLALTRPWNAPQTVAVAVALTLAWQLLGLGLVETPASGWLPLALALGAGALALRRGAQGAAAPGMASR